MAIAASIILFAIGAILAWGINAVVPHANLQTIGIILMIAGGVSFVVSLALLAPRRRVRQERFVRAADGSAERTVDDRELI